MGDPGRGLRTGWCHGSEISKTRAARQLPVPSGATRVADPGLPREGCSRSQQPDLGATPAVCVVGGRVGRVSRVLVLLCLGLSAGAAGLARSAAEPPAPAGSGPCAGPTIDFQALAPGLWYVPGLPGDPTAENRGQVSNLVVAPQGPRVWLLGSGASPAFGRALACRIRERWGRPVTDVISPWPRPELVLGVSGMGPVRHWAHAEVAAAMAQRCATCVARLRVQLGAAATDLGEAPVAVPDHRLQGERGQLGPWHWWRLRRGRGFTVTVWQFGDVPVRIAPGLLWGGTAPDGRDADVRMLARATDALERLPGKPGGGRTVRWLGEQGPPAAGLPEHHRIYWATLMQAVRAAQARGDAESEPAAPSPQVPAADPRHALNWQRAWRQLEAEEFQRSLR